MARKSYRKNMANRDIIMKKMADDAKTKDINFWKLGEMSQSYCHAMIGLRLSKGDYYKVKRIAELMEVTIA